MRPITEDEAWATVGQFDPPVLDKYECETARIAITLKRWPNTYVLALHRDEDDRLELFSIDDLSEAMEQFRLHVKRFEESNVLFD